MRKNNNCVAFLSLFPVGVFSTVFIHSRHQRLTTSPARAFCWPLLNGSQEHNAKHAADPPRLSVFLRCSLCCKLFEKHDECVYDLFKVLNKGLAATVTVIGITFISD